MNNINESAILITRQQRKRRKQVHYAQQIMRLKRQSVFFITRAKRQLINSYELFRKVHTK